MNQLSGLEWIFLSALVGFEINHDSYAVVEVLMINRPGSLQKLDAN